ncbi:MAG: cytochrome c, partial [Rhodospirillaceae bacterium]|nr:cytochrome c [Rhodospirillaceae bacterium]
VAEGRNIYAAMCAGCHGAKLEGQKNWRQRGDDGKLPAPPHNKTGHTWHHADEVLFEITKRGTGGALGLKDYESDMPAYEDTLTDRQIVAVLAFIKSNWPREILERQQEIDTRSIGKTE